MSFVEDIMDMPMPKAEDKNFGKVLQIKQQVAQSLLTTTVRVRDSLLRPVSDDGFAAVRAAIDAVEDLEDDVDIFA